MKSLEMLEDLRFKGNGLPMLESYYEECYNTIKKDLEILEILRMWSFLDTFHKDGVIYDCFRTTIHTLGMKEDYNKVKEWFF